ncbi:MAG: PSD1 domain-containing protein [Acidobacteria bacterium]|nr:PSD1 domain-containing protein [Acidobacteriota bacterium]
MRLSLVLFAFALRAEEAPRFEKDVLPVFTEYCFTCHGQSSPKQGLDLRTAVTTMRGSFSGPVVVKGSLEKSLLWKKVSTKVMPHEAFGRKMPDDKIEVIKRWIAGGALADNADGLGQASSEQRARYEKLIRPLFNERCVKCHGAGKPMGGLDLRDLAGLLKGSTSGPVVMEGASEKSVLVRKVASGAMPPPGSGKVLSEAEVQLLKEWINRGHLTDGIDLENPLNREFTKAEAPEITAEQRQFWAFRKPIAAKVPKVRAAARVRTPVDAFALARLEQNGLSFSVEASPTNLLRRAFLDLTGLPPSPEEVKAFLADPSATAYERVVDRLLASPQYGERWGRHWLDAAGYVDTTGKDFDPGRAEYADGMWRYRDYVIQSLNRDKPWDRFLTEQLAGDELTDWRSAKQRTPEMNELLAATGYLRNVLDITNEDITNLPVERYEALFKVVEKVGASTMGLTMHCARCHTHKFDPIPQRDYYRFLALFTTAFNPSDWLQPKNRHLYTVPDEEKQEVERYNKEIDGTVAKLKEQLATLRRPYEEQVLTQKLSKLPEEIREDARKAVATPVKDQTEVQKYLVRKFGASLKATDAELSKLYKAVDGEAAAKLDQQIKTHTSYKRKLDKIQALWDVGEPPLIRLLQRGNADAPGPKVTPGFPGVLAFSGSTDAVRPPQTQGKSSGVRLAFAQWLTHRDHPLTARVIVNRVWQHHFGAGLVATTDNFGKMGATPANQELLDWLAVDFMDHGWKEKRLHKLIMMSSVYRQSSRQGEESWVSKARTVDPENRLLWRMNLRRLDAEALRDSVLAMTGKLDRTMGGPPIALEVEPNGLLVVSRKEPPEAPWRRSVYLTARRNYPLTFLGAFDFPVIDTTCTRRIPSATPIQSLTMMNDPFLTESARLAAERFLELGGAERFIETAYLAQFARKAGAADVRMSEEYLARQEKIYRDANLPEKEAAARARQEFVQALLSSNEFLYID